MQSKLRFSYVPTLSRQSTVKFSISFAPISNFNYSRLSITIGWKISNFCSHLSRLLEKYRVTQHKKRTVIKKPQAINNFCSFLFGFQNLEGTNWVNAKKKKHSSFKKCVGILTLPQAICDLR